MPFSIHYDHEKYENFMDDPHCFTGKVANYIIYSLIILSVIVLSLESYGNIYKSYFDEFFIINFIIAWVFLVEYMYRLARSHDMKKFLIRPFNIIDALSFLAFYTEVIFSWYGILEFIIVLRLLRILRIFSFLKITPIVIRILKNMKLYREEYQMIITLIWVIAIIDAIFVFQFEHSVNPQFSSIPQALWWAIVTMTTVWYGDIYPITPLGKMFGLILMLSWPLMIAVVSWITVIIFMDEIELEKKMLQNKDFTHKCGRCFAHVITTANYCQHCWEKLKSIDTWKNIHESKRTKRLIAKK